MEKQNIYKEPKKMKRGDKTALLISRVFIWIFIVFMIFPAFWILSASFSKGDSFFMTSLLPSQVGLDNYVNLFKNTDFLLWVLNSLKLCVCVSAIQLFLTSTAAYAFSRLRFPGKKNGLKILLLLQVFPNSMAIAGYYILIYHFNLADNMLAIILVLSGGSAFNIWLLKNYIDGIPKELDESALVDGANHFQVFRKIVFPLARPQIIVILLFTFIATYSEYVITSVFLQSPQSFTLAIGLQTFITNQFAAHWTLFSAAAVISSLPIMFLFMVLQKYIQSGLTVGGVKE
jgi:arabinogalactan oligomer / maltooligosaccharide transport system permease protein